MRDSDTKGKSLLNPRLEPFLPYAKDTPPQGKSNSVYLAVSRWALLILSYLVLPLGLSNFVGDFTFKALKRRSKRQAFNSKEELCKDPRAPVLYLRPFHLDPPELPSIILPFRTPSEHLKHLSGGSPEEALTELLRQLGPVITVGKPGEELPQLGAIRLYFNDEDWQEKVTALMTLSQLVVIQPGYTEGLEWEMSLAKAHLQHYRLLFSFVCWRTLRKEPRQREYEIFKLSFERIYCISLPEQIGSALYLYFDHDWTPHLDYEGGYVNAILTRNLAARYGLKDVNDVDNPID